jgi:multidrug efflux pump subunit AcrA (membrane-fusion protein)
MKRLRIVVILAVIVVAVAAVIRISATPAPAAPGARAAAADITRVGRGDVQITVNATGPLEANQNVVLSFPMSGKVATINVAQGDYVRKGQTIATLDTQTVTDNLLVAQARLAAQQVALAQLTEKPRQVDIDVAQAVLAQAKTSLSSAQHSGADATTLQIDQLNVANAKNSLYQAQLARDAVNNQKQQLQSNPRSAQAAANLPSDNQENANINAADYSVQIAQNQLQIDQGKGANVGSVASAQAQVTSAQVALDNLLKGPDPNDVAKAQAQLEAAQAAVDAAKTALTQATLIAPFDGLVAQLSLNVGEQAPDGAVVFQDASSYYVDVPVTENDISSIQVGQPVTLVFDSLPGVTVNGKVIQVGQTGSKTSGVVTYTVRVQVSPEGKRLLPAMTATASIITSQAQNVVRVPNRFIQLDRATGKTYAYVQQADGSSKQVQVTLGLRNDTYSEVKSGLSAGDVITAPPSTGGQGGQGGAGRPGGPGGIFRFG